IENFGLSVKSGCLILPGFLNRRAIFGEAELAILVSLQPRKDDVGKKTLIRWIAAGLDRAADIAAGNKLLDLLDHWFRNQLRFSYRQKVFDDEGERNHRQQNDDHPDHSGRHNFVQE